MRITAPAGHFSVRYDATVDIAHHFESPARIEETAIACLPPEVKSFAPAIAIEAVDDPVMGFTLPRHCVEAVSTYGARAMSL